MSRMPNNGLPMPPETTLPVPLSSLHEVETRFGIAFAEHDGTVLAGDFYRPKGMPGMPVIVAVHGGAWQIGASSRYQHWGPFLAQRGYALFAITYRLSTPAAKSFPHAFFDVKAGIQFIRARAAEFGIDPERIAVVGDSAGAHLGSLVALAWNEPIFAGAYLDDQHAATPAHVKAVVGFYGVYDLLAQWEHDQLKRSGDQITEKFLGAPPRDNRRIYFDASPISYATTDRNQTRFLLIDGTHDDIVDANVQGAAFLTALKNANFFARAIVVPGAGHFWITDPIEESGSYGSYAAPKLLRFLQISL